MLFILWLTSLEIVLGCSVAFYCYLILLCFCAFLNLVLSLCSFSLAYNTPCSLELLAFFLHRFQWTNTLSLSLTLTHFNTHAQVQSSTATKLDYLRDHSQSDFTYTECWAYQLDYFDTSCIRRRMHINTWKVPQLNQLFFNTIFVCCSWCGCLRQQPGLGPQLSA